jgi:L-alanine-DL-glutamate epimerase-like enolase superfamily enzyme
MTRAKVIIFIWIRSSLKEDTYENKKVETKVFEGQAGVSDQLFVSIYTDDGFVGIGKTWWGLSIKPVQSAIENVPTPQVLGQDSTRIEYLWEQNVSLCI